MKPYTVKVKVIYKHRRPGEKTYEFCFSSNDVEKFCQAVKEALFCASYNSLVFPDNLEYIGSLGDIYYKIKREIYKQYLNDLGIDDIPVITRDLITDIERQSVSLTIEFPPEWLYPYIWRRGTYLTMESCFFSREFAIEGANKLKRNNDIIGFLQRWHLDPYVNPDNTGRINNNDLDSIFYSLDLPMLYHLFVKHEDAQYETMDLMFGDMCDYLSKNKQNSCFGITYLKKGEKKNLPCIKYPEFGGKARLVLFRKFFIQRRQNACVNSLKYQLSPGFAAGSKKCQETESENSMETFSEIDGWYYEMCTGISLSLAISAQLLELSESKSIICSPWADYRICVLLKILKKCYPLIVSCPAVYWRIRIFKEIIRNVDDRMQRPQLVASPHYSDTHGPSPARNEWEWFDEAYQTFCSEVEKEFRHRLEPVGYQGTLIQFPKILMEQAFLSHYLECSSSKKLTCQGRAKPFKYNPYVYSCSEDRYSEMIQGWWSILKGSNSSEVRHDMGGKYGKIFKLVRDALYPDGFIDFQA